MVRNDEIVFQIKNYQALAKLKVNDLLLKQLEDDQDLIDHKNYEGHVTASGLVIYKNRVLLIFHNRIKKWFQPGGHLEYSDKTLAEAAQREVEEETGLKVKLSDWHIENNSPIMIDTHLIPAYKTIPPHFHHDFRYVFIPKDDNIKLQLEEVEDFAWVDISDNKIKEEKSNIKAYELAKRLGLSR